MTELYQEFKFHEEFKEFLSLEFPNGPFIGKNLLSEHILKLPKSLETRLKKCLDSFKNLGENQLYQKFILEKRPSEPPLFPPPLIAFDFHLLPDNTPRLIEINSNPAFLTGSHFLAEFWRRKKNLPHLSGHKIKEKLLQSFQNFFLKKIKRIERILILDENLQQQSFSFEFDYLKKWFSEKWNCDVLILEPKSLPLLTKKVDVIYNRLTDFYLLNHPKLLQDWKEKKFLLFPDPDLYALFSDKTRLVDWWKINLKKEFGLSEEDHQNIKSVLVESFVLKEKANKEEVWNKRKKYFFKPLHSFGGKASYRGRSISKKKFYNIAKEEHMMAQEEVPPPSFNEKLKYDLRCYVLKGEFKMAVGRLYSGQVTNFQNPEGGFAPVQWIPSC